MKGPGLRLEHEVRRLWVCLDCGQSLRLHGSITYQRCDCRGVDSPWMQLIEAAPVFPPRHVIDCASCEEEEQLLGPVENDDTREPATGAEFNPISEPDPECADTPTPEPHPDHKSP